METVPNSNSGIDGISILRFTHAFASGGGVENYLNDLNHSLLNRNKITIIQIFYANGIKTIQETIYSTGRGKLINIAVPPPTTPDPCITRHKLISQNIAGILRNCLSSNYVFHQLFKPLGQRYGIKAPGMNTDDIRKLICNLFAQYQVDLISLHCIGADDTEQIIDLATSRKIPFFYLNHYANDMFNHFFVREQLSLADGIGIAGVSDCGIPRYVKKQFVSLYDGINTSFFSREKISLTQRKYEHPVIFLPARICGGKGHRDIIKAAVLLKKEGISVHIIFAGINDSSEFGSNLKSLIHQSGLSDNVSILDQCNQEQLRELYAQSSIVALPSKSEGFPRVLLEAQAMSVPVVTYNVGGSSQSLLPSQSGYLCKYGAFDELKKALKILLTDESLRSKMGKAGREFVIQNFTLEHLAQRHEMYYRSILKGYRSIREQ